MSDKPTAVRRTMRDALDDVFFSEAQVAEFLAVERPTVRSWYHKNDFNLPPTEGKRGRPFSIWNLAGLFAFKICSDAWREREHAINAAIAVEECAKAALPEMARLILLFAHFEHLKEKGKPRSYHEPSAAEAALKVDSKVLGWTFRCSKIGGQFHAAHGPTPSAAEDNLAEVLLKTSINALPHPATQELSIGQTLLLLCLKLREVNFGIEHPLSDDPEEDDQ